MRMCRTQCACNTIFAHVPYFIRMRHTQCACSILNPHAPYSLHIPYPIPSNIFQEFKKKKHFPNSYLILPKFTPEPMFFGKITQEVLNRRHLRLVQNGPIRIPYHIFLLNPSGYEKCASSHHFLDSPTIHFRANIPFHDHSGKAK